MKYLFAAIILLSVAVRAQVPAKPRAMANIDAASKQSPSPDHPKMGRDGLAGGSADDIWQKVQSGGKEIYVRTNEHNSSGVFHTYVVANLPESDIVGAPKSVMNDVEGNCTTRRFHVIGALFFAGKNRSGMAMESTPSEEFERKLVPNSPFEKAFDMLCENAREKSSQSIR